jgi:hypothetical protein
MSEVMPSRTRSALPTAPARRQPLGPYLGLVPGESCGSPQREDDGLGDGGVADVVGSAWAQ